MTPFQDALELPWCLHLECERQIHIQILSSCNKCSLHSPMPKFEHSMHHVLHDVTHPFLPCVHNTLHYTIQKNHFLSLLHHASLAATKTTCPPHKFVKMYDPSPIMKQPYFQLLTNGRSILQSFWNTPLHPFTFLTPLPINDVNDAFQRNVCIHHHNCSSNLFSIFISHVKSLKKIGKSKRFCTWNVALALIIFPYTIRTK